MKKVTCCKDMIYHLDFKCDIHKDAFECPDKIVYYSKKQNTTGIIIHDGGTSFIEINYCPWCGEKLNTNEPNPRN